MPIDNLKALKCETTLRRKSIANRYKTTKLLLKNNAGGWYFAEPLITKGCGTLKLANSLKKKCRGRRPERFRSSFFLSGRPSA